VREKCSRRKLQEVAPELFRGCRARTAEISCAPDGVRGPRDAAHQRGVAARVVQRLLRAQRSRVADVALPGRASPRGQGRRAEGIPYRHRSLWAETGLRSQTGFNSTNPGREASGTSE